MEYSTRIEVQRRARRAFRRGRNSVLAPRTKEAAIELARSVIKLLPLRERFGLVAETALKDQQQAIHCASMAIATAMVIARRTSPLARATICQKLIEFARELIAVEDTKEYIDEYGTKQTRH